MKFNKQKVIKALPFLMFGYFANKLSQTYQASIGANIGDKIMSTISGIGGMFKNPLPSFNPIDLLVGATVGAIIMLVIYVKGKNAKKYRKGVEYGSARWGTAEDIKPYTADKFEDNVILTETERLTMDSRPKAGAKFARNKNVLVIGGSGSGKTRFFVKPNLLQMHSSYVVTDPKGTVLIETGNALKQGGYNIKVVNTVNFAKSMHYNPFEYIRSEKDILKLVNTIIANTKGEGNQGGEDFWIKAERLYYSALIGYIWYEATDDEKNLITLIDMINMSEAKYENYDTLTSTMINEFIEKIVVHERDRKGSSDTTQKIEIYFNFIGRYVPMNFNEAVELTPEEQAELKKREERKDRLHRNYLKRKEQGKEKEYYERAKAKKKQVMDEKKNELRAEDIEKGIFIPQNQLPQATPTYIGTSA